MENYNRLNKITDYINRKKYLLIIFAILMLVNSHRLLHSSLPIIKNLLFSLLTYIILIILFESKNLIIILFTIFLGNICIIFCIIGATCTPINSDNILIQIINSLHGTWIPSYKFTKEIIFLISSLCIIFFLFIFIISLICYILIKILNYIYNNYNKVLINLFPILLLLTISLDFTVESLAALHNYIKDPNNLIGIKYLYHYDINLLKL